MTLKTKTCNKMYWPGIWHLFNEISAWSLMSLATGMWGIHPITIRCTNDVQWYYCICRMSSSSFCHPSQRPPEFKAPTRGGLYRCRRKLWWVGIALFRSARSDDSGEERQSYLMRRFDGCSSHKSSGCWLIDQARDACAVWVIDRKHFKDEFASSQQANEKVF